MVHMTTDITLKIIYLSLAGFWLRSGVGKIIGGKFPDELAGTLAKFMSNNPYSWYKDFISSVIIPSANSVGQIIMYGEICAGLAIVSGILLSFRAGYQSWSSTLLLAGLIGGLILSLNFYLASGWMSSSGESLNLLMLILELVGVLRLVIPTKNNT